MDIKKLKYDLAMQYMVIDMLKNPPEDANSPFFDQRIYMMDKFKSCYQYFSILDDSNWDDFKHLDD